MLILTRETLAAAYDLLDLTAPFDKWNLPPSDEVKFEVTNHKDRHGDQHEGPPHTIRVSRYHIGRLTSLIETVAHEMVHVHVDRSGIKEAPHGPAFRKYASQVCRHHGFDPKLF